ncbi:MAG: UDP-galactopyranose mutase [Candidatus Omnitrophica bacterium]|nr:UDP-galactopyranose mutase [Candidatus Omnitrophota bacterium]
MKRYDFIIVGSGLYGAVLAQALHASGRSVLIIERRGHIGGNCYSYEYEDTGITLHKYGTHIFHCSNRRTWEYMSRFGEFNRYQHRVLTTCQNRVYSMPVNLGTINAFYGVNLRPAEVDAFMRSKITSCDNPRNLEEMAVSLIGRELYEVFIKGYTKKHWGCDPRELPPGIINRLPVRSSYFDSYYNDYYQGVPVEGYTKLFEKMLAGIPVELNTDFFDGRDRWLRHCDTLIYTGCIDRFFDYIHGRLSWRSVRFETERLPMNDFQGAGVMNYADEAVPYTRIHEPKHLHREKSHKEGTTVIVREYPHTDHREPYYPVGVDADKEKLTKYQALASREKQVIFGGRLADYKYYDMHQAIEAALAVFEERCAK